MHPLSFITFISLAVACAQASAHGSIVDGGHVDRFERRAKHAMSAKQAAAARKAAQARAAAAKKAAAVAAAKKAAAAAAAKKAAAEAAAKKAAAEAAAKKAAAAAAAKKASAANKAPAPATVPAKSSVAGDPPAGVWSGQSTFVQQGTTGVSAMQLAVVDNNSVLILDKSEHNPLQVSGHPAWGQWMNIATGKSMALDLQTNSFCAGGAFLSNGTMVSFGGNPTTSSNAFHDGNGLQAVRIFNNCNDNGCSVYENPSRIRLTSPRWYASGTRLADGSIFIAGGMVAGGFNNVPATDNPTYEYFPPKSINNGLQIKSPFLKAALNSNLFPVMFLLPDNTIFMASNKLAQIYNWQTNTEKRLPSLPWRVTYPWTSASALLPLTPANGYTPTMLFCGGSNQNDAIPANQMSSSMSTLAGCATMTLNSAGIAGGWKVTDTLPEGRIMGETVIMPDGKILIINGAGTGVAGYSNVPNQIGQSNANNPVMRPVLYDPTAAPGQRISYRTLPTSNIPRMYHSTATLLPDGRVMIAGSNPNADRSNVKFATEYRIEYFNPPYMTMSRPSFTHMPSALPYNSAFTLTVSLPAGTAASAVTVSLMDLGYHTHGIGMDMRMVQLVVQSLNGNTLTVVGPPNVNIFPPGVGFLYVLADGVPSVGQKVLVGNGTPPPSSANAVANMLEQTSFITRISSLAADRISHNVASKTPEWDPDHPVAMDEGGNLLSEIL